MTNLFPNFIIPGAGKSGTTWLHACCEEHPGIFVPPQKKEIDFFSKHYLKGEGFYTAFFLKNTKSLPAGDFSPSYMINPEAPARIYKWNPKCKLVFLLRHPVDRAYSHYCMHLRSGKVTDQIERTLVLESRLVKEGMYFYHLSKFLTYFSLQQFHFILFEDLCNSPDKVLNNFFSFINGDIHFRPSILHKKYHQRKFRPKHQELYNTFVKICTNLSTVHPYFKKIFEYTRKRGIVDIFHLLNKGQPFPPLPINCRKKLLKIYRHDTLSLQKLLKRDLSSWLK